MSVTGAIPVSTHVVIMVVNIAVVSVFMKIVIPNPVTQSSALTVKGYVIQIFVIASINV